MSRIIQILSILCVALHIPISAAAQVATGSDGVYQWVPERLIPNEFGLPNGTWANASIRDCIRKCSVDKLCSGFSIQKSFGDALRGGCKDGLCDQKTECHAKGPYGSSVLWTPTDAQIRVPKVDAKSNSWMTGWGTVLKK
jgi:hypothetical protein